ncbi:hypothetical protein BDN67DRAFT_1016340 [Paxillus ammoniavirescens]|nr:hypothetical protein BDN67DRAFT_1016340 [Paxillus ammoniavirescens]
MQHVHAKDAYERVIADNRGHSTVGSIIRTAPLSRIKNLPSNISRKVLKLILRMPRAGISLTMPTWQVKSKTRHTKPVNKLFIVMDINQLWDALDAYSRAIRINTYISKVWFNLGSLYESNNNQISDAIDAYAHASEFDPSNHVISQRLQLLKTPQATGGQLPVAPGPRTSTPQHMLAPFSHLQVSWTASSLTVHDNIDALFTSFVQRGPPPPVVFDETRHIPSHTPLAPMLDIDRPAHHHDFSGPHDSATRGPAGHQNILLHHPVLQQQVPTDELQSVVHGPGQHQEYFNHPIRVPSTSASPPPLHRTRSPGPSFQPYPPSSCQLVGPAQPAGQRSPPSYPREPVCQGERDMAWECRGPPPEHHHDWEQRGQPEYPGHHSQQSYPSRSPGPHYRATSLMETSRSSHPSTHHPRPCWDSKPPNGPPHPRSPPPGPSVAPENRHWRYDLSSIWMSELPNSTPASDGKQRKQAKEKGSDAQSVMGSAPGDPPKQEWKKCQCRPKDEQAWDPHILQLSSDFSWTPRIGNASLLA